MEGLTRYQVMDLLGTGSQGTSYRAIDRKTAQEVVLKVFALEKSASWEEFARFEQEREVLAKLRHPGIVRLLDAFAHEEKGEYYLVLELARGSSLQVNVERHLPLPRPLAWALLNEALGILDYLHNFKPTIIHRDIKPAHLFVTPENHVQLVDFGAIGQAKRTSGYTVIGTPGYAAPEQAHGSFSPKSDLYALGMSLVAALAGQPIELLPRQGLEVDLNRVLEAGPLADTLAAMIRADPRERIDSAAAALRILNPDRGPQASNGTSSGRLGGSHTPSKTDPNTAMTRADEVPSLARFIHEALSDVDQIEASGLRRLTWVALTILTWFFAAIEFLILPFAFRVADELQDQGPLRSDPRGGGAIPPLSPVQAQPRGRKAIHREVQESRRALKSALDRLSDASRRRRG
jgi:serine/threonine protein kinase